MGTIQHHKNIHCLEMNLVTKRTRIIFGILLFLTGTFLVIASWFPIATIRFVTTDVKEFQPTYLIAFTNIQNTFRGDVRWFPNTTVETAIRSTTVLHSQHVARRLKRDRFSSIPNCTTRHTGVEDLLCMQKPELLPQYRNPCWNQDGKLRCLPYFHIIGVCKSGTSDLFKRITTHPHVLKNRGILNKELWYWTWLRYGETNFHRRSVPKSTLDTFIDSFSAKEITRIKKPDNNSMNGFFYPAITGHGDPMDFWDQTDWKKIPQNDPDLLLPEVTTPSLIKHVNPNVKLILMLRDPIERLFSHYLHGHFGTSADQFHNDVKSTLNILQSCNTTLALKACLYSKDIMKTLKVPISASFYSVHLSEWLRVFPREQILILRTEEFSKNVATSLVKVFRFLRIEPLSTRDLYQTANMPHFYYTKAKRYAGTIHPETVQILQDIFDPYNRELATMLNDTNFLWK